MAKFSKGAFIAMASALNLALDNARVSGNWPFIPDTRRGGILIAAEVIADMFMRDNPQFNHAHFMAVVKGDADPNSRPPKGDQ